MTDSEILDWLERHYENDIHCYRFPRPDGRWFWVVYEGDKRDVIRREKKIGLGEGYPTLRLAVEDARRILEE